jgi:hypothetical protein
VRKFLSVTKIFNTMEITKQCIGIDVSKDSLDVIFKEQVNQKVKVKGSRKFDNNSDGFSQLIKWSNKREKCENIFYIIEATGIYHEELLYFLYNDDKKVCVELPQRIKYFAKSKGVKTKNDQVDSSIIADYGIEGNANLRPALYMPAMTSIQHDKKMKNFYNRIMQTHQFKKQGMVAVMRKLLILSYTLWKKNEPYDENYVWNKAV